MNEQEIVAGFNEWLRQYAADPGRFADMEKLADDKAHGGAVTYGDRCFRTLKRCAEDAARQS